jgi:2-dehydro-3-deoxyphosphogluconate aldolase/(4S)-4-hydroxy-2-oxoglutarate aldolase
VEPQVISQQFESKCEFVQLLANKQIIPIIQSDEPVEAVQIARALLAGGMTAVEVVLRSPNAIICLQAIADSIPLLAIGAGTVTSVEKAKQAYDAGAEFIVSPGLDQDIVAYASEKSLSCLPGIATPTELQAAARLGLSAVKAFPASMIGGPTMIRALSSVFPRMAFVPTGGLNEDNFLEYLRIPAVKACGGSWVISSEAVRRGDFSAIEASARAALDKCSDTVSN